MSAHWLHSAGFAVRLRGVLELIDDLCACFLLSQTASLHSALARGVSRGGLLQDRGLGGADSGTPRVSHLEEHRKA